MDITPEELADLMELGPRQDAPYLPSDNLGHTMNPIEGADRDDDAPQDDLSGSLAHVLTGDPTRIAAARRMRRPTATLNPQAAEVRDWLKDDDAGYLISGRAGKVGMTGHRSILFPGQHADRDVVVTAIEERLGCTVDEFRSVYARNGGGPLPRHLHGLRDRLNIRLARIQAVGGSLPLLAQWMGVNPRALQRALERSRGN
jgi:hypothetical protein